MSTPAHTGALTLVGVLTVVAALAGYVSEGRADAAPAASLVVPAVLEYRAGTQPLAAFHASLRKSAVGQGKTRILFFGDSHTAADFMTGRLRDRLQQRYGDGGPGFVVTGRPWRFYRHDRLDEVSSTGLTTSRAPARLTSAPTLPLGLTGTELDSNGQDATATLRLHARDVGSEPLNMELFYLRRPSGGVIELRADAQPVGRIETRDERFAAGYFAFTTKAREISLGMAAGDAVGLYGLAIESARPGVVLDSLGIPGARARAQLAWHDEIFESQVRHRAPQLVVLSYGTNEATDKEEDIGVFERQFTAVLARIRRMTPEASCLVLGPTDHVERGEDRAYRPKPRTADIIAVQRQITLDAGCAYIDLVRVGGGPMSTLRASRMRPARAARDLVHMTRLGYTEFGDALYEALVKGTERDQTAGHAHGRAR